MGIPDAGLARGGGFLPGRRGHPRGRSIRTDTPVIHRPLLRDAGKERGAGSHSAVRRTGMVPGVVIPVTVVVVPVSAVQLRVFSRRNCPGTVRVMPVHETIAIVVQAVGAILHHGAGTVGGHESRTTRVAGQGTTGESTADAGLSVQVCTVTDFAGVQNAVSAVDDRRGTVYRAGGGILTEAAFAVTVSTGGTARRAPAGGVVAVDPSVAVVVLAVVADLHTGFTILGTVFSTFAEAIAADRVFRAIGRSDDAGGAGQRTTVETAGYAGLSGEVAAFTLLFPLDDSIAADGLASLVAGTIHVFAVDETVEVIVEPIGADFEVREAIGRLGTVGVITVDGTIEIIVQTVIADLLGTHDVACRMACAVGIRAVDQAVAVIIDFVGAVLGGHGALGSRGAVGILAVHGAISIVVDVVVAEDFGVSTGAVAGSGAVAVFAVDLAVGVVVDFVVAEDLDILGVETVITDGLVSTADEGQGHDDQEKVEILHGNSPFA